MSDTLQDLEYDTIAKKTTTVTVLAVPKNEAPWVCFSMVANYPNGGGTQDKDKLEFGEFEGQFDVTFDLDDKSGKHLSFYDDFADAMWVTVGDACPTRPGNGNGAIQAGKVTSKKKIEMVNLNEDQATLTFMLRFTGDATDGKYPPYEYDPKIINGGDGPPITSDDDDDEQGDQRG